VTALPQERSRHARRSRGWSCPRAFMLGSSHRVGLRPFAAVNSPRLRFPVLESSSARS
jgi:hypothetical protein